MLCSISINIVYRYLFIIVYKSINTLSTSRPRHKKQNT